MEKLNEILEKYFRGETTINEENELKKHFLSDSVAPEHEMYRSMFTAFEQEKQETMNPSKKLIEPRKRSLKRLWIQTFSYSGIAAAILLTLWIQRPVPSENYAVVSGRRIEDSEYAQKYVERKLNKASEILTNGMKPMQSIDKVRESMKPMEKISETREKIEEIQNKLQIK